MSRIIVPIPELLVYAGVDLAPRCNLFVMNVVYETSLMLFAATM